MEFVIAGIIILLVLITYGLIVRKKIYEQVNKAEAWKIDIMNRPVTDEIAKVKQLNMTGQTEEKFEAWRQSWDEIVTVSLPKIEEMLFDTEEAADRYRFKKAGKIIALMNKELQGIEDEISSLLAELDDLIGSEEKNRIEVEELKFELKKVKKQLLSERHEYRKSEIELEKEIENTEKLFKEFTEKTGAGNYFEAREVVLLIRNEISRISEKIEVIPRLIHECAIDIPTQITEMRHGYMEMIGDGFILEEFKILEELEKMEVEVEQYLQLIENANIEEASNGLIEVKDRMEQLYDVLEQEVIAKQQIAVTTPYMKDEIELLKYEYEQTAIEVDTVAQSYHLKEEDITQLKEIEKNINVIIRKFQGLQDKVTENSYPSSALYKELEKIRSHIMTVKQNHDEYNEMLTNLRKDEIGAKEEIAKSRKQLLEARRLVQKSNLPGLPSNYLIELEEVQNGILEVAGKLEEMPINMEAVNLLLENVVHAADRLQEKTEEMLEKAELVEKVIQYGNRYRSRVPLFAARLAEAEHLFRNFEYDAALEEAATAIEEIEPGSMKKLNKLLLNIDDQ